MIAIWNRAFRAALRADQPTPVRKNTLEALGSKETQQRAIYQANLRRQGCKTQKLTPTELNRVPESVILAVQKTNMDQRANC